MKNELQDKCIIKCPFCGAEYLPGELLIPNNVVGQPSQVTRDSFNHIIYYEYLENREPLAKEKYVCDFCGREFVINIKPSYTTNKQDELLDFTVNSVNLF